MSFEEWKLHRELHDETEFDAYRSKIRSISNFCFIVFGVTVVTLITAVVFCNFLP